MTMIELAFQLFLQNNAIKMSIICLHIVVFDEHDVLDF